MKKQRILVVDDNEELLVLGRHIYESAGYEVITARDGLEALSELESTTVSLVITDVQMPHLDGYSLCCSIRMDEKNSEIPVIIYTGTYTSQTDEEFALQIGASMFIRKPASEDILLNAARSLIMYPNVTNRTMNSGGELSDVTKQYNIRLIEKLKQKNEELQIIQKELLKSESRFRALIEYNFDAISLKDEVGNILYRSPAFERMLGYSTEDSQTLNAADIVHPEELQEALSQHQLSIKNPGKPIFGRKRMRHKAGHYIWTEGSSTNLLDNEHVQAIVGNFRDISESVEKQKQLEFDRQNLDALINNTQDLMWSVSTDFRLITSNAAFGDLILSMLGKKLTKGCNILEYSISDTQRERYRQYYIRAFSGTTFRVTERTEVPFLFLSEISFCPIVKDSKIVGTACYAHDITDQKIAQEKIAKTQRKLNAIFENSSESLILCDCNGDIKIFNDNARKTMLLTCSTEMTIGNNIREYISEERKEIFDNILQDVNAGKRVQYEQSFEDNTGRFYCYDFHINPVLEDGQVKSLCFNGRDVTESKIARERIEKNERRLEAERGRFTELFQQAPSCICILNGPEHVFEMTNPTYLELTGKKDIIGKKLAEVFPEVESQGFLSLMNDTFSTGKPFVANEVLVQIYRDNTDKLTDHYLNFVCQPYRNSDGEIEGIFFFANIVTEQVLARRKIERDEKRYRALVENGSDAVVILSGAGQPLYVSSSIERVLGYSEEEAMNLNLFSAIHPEDLSGVQNVMSQVILAPGIPITGYPGRILHKDGTWHWYEATVTNMLADPDIGGIVDNFRDVTERVLAQEKIIKANRLYSFISQINQTIVHANNEEVVFGKACSIAIEYGKFQMAWIGLIDRQLKTINLVEESGIPEEDIHLFTNANYELEGPQWQVLETGSSFICNDVEAELKFPVWVLYARKRGIKSFMVLPIRRNGEIIGTYNLYASEKHLFDKQEITLLEEAAGDISFALGIFEKERHRWQLAEKVAISELQLCQAQAMAHIGSWAINFIDGFSTWSEEACRIYGLSPTDTRQAPDAWVTYVHPDDRERVTTIIDKDREALRSSAFHCRIVRSNGEVRHIYTQSEFEFDGLGKPKGLRGIVQDFTEMNMADEALRLSEANLRLIMNLIPQSIFAKDIEGTYLFVNKSFAKLYGLVPEQLLKKKVTETIPLKSESEYFLEQDKFVILSGETKIIPEHPFTDYEGNVRLFNTIKVPFTVAEANTRAVLGIATDITEQKRAEAERGRMMADIVQRNSDLEQFSYIISHNLRAPVANIMGITSLLQYTQLNDREKTEMMEALATSTNKLDMVIKDLNLILQVKHGINEKRELISFDVLLENIKVSISNLINDEGVVIKSDFSEVNDIMTLKSYMHSVFYNLIVNSIKYRRPGHSPVIEIKSFLQKNTIVLKFKDNGLGIDLNKSKDQLFGLYKRFHNHVEGKGIGLYMVKTQVETIGGRISVISEVNEGTEFIIEFDI